ncbi:hypothetical protein [Parapedobacter sp. DT-150]|uniref:hypothetical protein n=1 Tax=Parapedobacter sp. DT-150 TaxID=3396162 RepID=UPI003F1AF1DB
METPKKQSITAPAYLGEEIQQLVEIIINTLLVEKIICFGSIVQRVVRKSCFEEAVCESPVVKNSYSLLIIPALSNTSDGLAIEQQVEEACRPCADVTAIVHTMDDVNSALCHGSGFFSAIYKYGALIHDQQETAFATPGEQGYIQERVAKRERFWDRRHALAEGFIQGAAFFCTKVQPSLGVCMLHQAMQHCYAGMLRVMTGYRTGSQQLNRLQRLIEATLSFPSILLPRHTTEDTRLSEVLMKGHGVAHYDHTLSVSIEDLAELIDRVSTIIAAADQHCRKRLQQLKEGDIAYIR